MNTSNNVNFLPNLGPSPENHKNTPSQHTIQDVDERLQSIVTAIHNKEISIKELNGTYTLIIDPDSNNPSSGHSRSNCRINISGNAKIGSLNFSSEKPSVEFEGIKIKGGGQYSIQNRTLVKNNLSIPLDKKLFQEAIKIQNLEF